MKTVVFVLLHALRSCFGIRLALQAENLALRHQITVLQRGRKHIRRTPLHGFQEKGPSKHVYLVS